MALLLYDLRPLTSWRFATPEQRGKALVPLCKPSAFRQHFLRSEKVATEIDSAFNFVLIQPRATVLIKSENANASDGASLPLES